MEYMGRILSGIGGLYRVETEQGVIECRARGSLRRDSLVPSAGDLVTVSAEGEDGVIERILPRRNAFVRPPVANVDRLVIVMSLVQPAPHAAVIDKMITIAESKDVSPVLVLNKIDSGDAVPWRDLYGHLGYPFAEVSAVRQEGIAELRRLLTVYGEFRRGEIQPSERAVSAARSGDRRDQPQARTRAAYDALLLSVSAAGRRVCCGYARLFAA